jgi:hypothetical protein
VDKPVTRGSHHPKRPHLSVVRIVKERAFEKQGVEKRDYTALVALVNSPTASGPEWHSRRAAWRHCYPAPKCAAAPALTA